jgi:hypothetical protein
LVLGQGADIPLHQEGKGRVRQEDQHPDFQQEGLPLLQVEQ